MLSDRHHVIKRQILEVEVDPSIPATGLQNRMSQLYRQKIVPLLDAYCSQWSDAETVHRIDRLEIDLGEIDLTTFDTDYVAKAAEALAEQLAQRLSRSSPTLPSTATASPHTTAFSSPTTPPESPPSDNAHPRSPTAPPATNPSAIHANTSTSLSPLQAQLELIQTFLTTGQLPWWSAPLDRSALVDCFQQLATAAPHPLAAWLSRALKSPTVRQRVLSQFPETVWSTIFQLLAPATYTAVQAYLIDVEQLRPAISLWRTVPAAKFRLTLWEGLLLNVVLATPASPIDIPLLLQANLLHLATQLHLDPPLLIQKLNAAISAYSRANLSLSSQLPIAIASLTSTHFEAYLTTSPTASSAAPPPTAAAIASSSEEEHNLASFLHSASSSQALNDLYLQNAGQVILSPFLQPFFTNLELLEAGQWTNLEAAQQAALILQYLIDESLISVESSLSLNKLLCGFDLSATLPVQLALTPAIESACTTLLTAIIQHWSILGNTTIAGLRSAFLQRAGLLRRRHDGWLLQVEQQTPDILLDRLPWSIRVVKLPWMTEILYVEWQ